MGRWWPAVLIGLGGFQFYDGTIQHKLLKIHQIRYEVVPTKDGGPGPYEPIANIAAYDTVWLVLAVLFIAVGVWGWHRGSADRA